MGYINDSSTQTIAVKFITQKERNNTCKSQLLEEGTGSFVNEDFSKETLAIRKKMGKM